MSKKLEIKDFKIGESVSYKSMKIGTHGREALTPVKAVDLSKIKSKIGFGREDLGVNEIYKTVYEKDQLYSSEGKKGTLRIASIKRMNDDQKLQEQFENQLIFLKKKAREKDITMCILDYQGDRYPNKEEIEFLADMSYVYSDLVSFPVISNTKTIKSPEDFSKYFTFLKRYLEILNALNDKPIIGIVPKIGRTYMDTLFNFYYDNDINAFYFDFECKQPLKLHANITKFLRKLKDEDLVEKSFLHSTNIYSGRFLVSDYVINAKDILSFGLGFDSMGRNTRKPLPAKFIESLPPQPERKFRLFNKDDYGYYQLKPEKIKDILPKDTRIQLADFLNTHISKYDLQHSFNMEQQGFEAIKLRKIIEEKPDEYLKKKKYVDKKDIETLKKIHDTVMKGKTTTGKMKTLFDF
jgi:hypothetical protein